MISLGCAKNRVDSEIMLGELRAKGYELAADLDAADTVIVNTCGFVEEARKESIDAILEVAARKAQSGDGKPGKRLLVAGCMVNRHGEELRREIPEIDGFVSLDQLRQVDQVVQLGGGPPLPAPSHLVFDHTAPRLLTTRGYAYLKVAEGCNNPCTFCAIPVWRGRFRSRTIDSLVIEAQELEAAGIQELCLIAQDTTRFGEDLDGWESKAERRHGLLRLVEALLARTNIPWIRFLYAYPTTLDRELLRLMGQEPRFCSYLDIPLQHSHPEMLGAMRRGGSAERYRRLLDEARELAPDVFLRTTFITGFPGETEEHFAHLLRFVEDVRFDHLGAFVYSPEEGTPGAALPNRVPRRVARRRWEKLLATQREIALERRQRLVGRRMTALVEGVCEESEHLLQARHHGMAPEVDGRLLINDGVAAPTSFAMVEITDAFADDLVGRIVDGVGEGERAGDRIAETVADKRAAFAATPAL
ncbi:MAG TPA: 30S ribosomal protein S12 methylthiotransferase RimO [Thermoanaerobaculia bacterium]|jgi:ribosomal protein S12 methylthiotransferase|nr:30S ribosomal protein S12 methylthiotransferase RimO [Thermoanaerobaculia bacterium]